MTDTTARDSQWVRKAKYAAVAIWFAFVAYKPLFGTHRADQKAAQEPGVPA
ncbi:MAG: hypothetical protein M5U23_01380 [Acidimicrobiia bacterium]|nr:hypothetical protein [Acidimicrobiia bacterium]